MYFIRVFASDGKKIRGKMFPRINGAGMYTRIKDEDMKYLVQSNTSNFKYTNNGMLENVITKEFARKIKWALKMLHKSENSWLEIGVEIKTKNE